MAETNAMSKPESINAHYVSTTTPERYLRQHRPERLGRYTRAERRATTGANARLECAGRNTPSLFAEQDRATVVSDRARSHCACPQRGFPTYDCFPGVVGHACEEPRCHPIVHFSSCRFASYRFQNHSAASSMLSLFLVTTALTNRSSEQRLGERASGASCFGQNRPSSRTSCRSQRKPCESPVPESTSLSNRARQTRNCYMLVTSVYTYREASTESCSEVASLCIHDVISYIIHVCVHLVKHSCCS